MTTEQAADKLGMVAVVWPNATEARRAEVYAALNADQRKAVYTLFGYGDAPVQPEEPSRDIPWEALLASLQGCTEHLRRAPTAPPVVMDSPQPTAPPAARSADMAVLLRELTEQIERAPSSQARATSGSRACTVPASR